MMQNICSLATTRDQHIVAYVYQEGPLDERIGFERHLASCAVCRAEVDGFRGVRAELSQWASPEADFAVVLPEAGIAAPSVVMPLPRRAFPVWAQAAAAALIVGVGAGAANLHVNYSAASGLSVRTGWYHDEAPAAPPVAVQAAAPADTESWRLELAALEQRLRSEMQSHPATVPVSSSASGDDLRRVRTLVDESERRQQRDVALRFAEMAREVESQRQSDLARIDRNLGLVQSRTGMEVMRTQQQVNSLAQRVSQRQ